MQSYPGAIPDDLRQRVRDPEGSAGVRAQVVLCASAEDRVRLAEMLERLRFQVHAGAPTLDSSPLRSARPVAAVISDSLEHFLDLCREWAALCPVILVSNVSGFHYRVAAARAGATAVISRPVNPAEISEWLAYSSELAAAEKSTDQSQAGSPTSLEKPPRSGSPRAKSSEHRVHPRQRVFKGGKIVLNAGRSVMDCTIRDLSAQGARLKLLAACSVPEVFDLRIENAGPPRRSELVWQHGSNLGVRFTD